MNRPRFRAECSLAALLCLAGGNVALAQGALPKLPDLQRGQWKVTGTDNRSNCGHPLDSLYKEYEEFGKLRDMGCKVDVTSPKARTVAVSVECPKDSKIGLVQTAFTLSSPKPQSFSMEWVRKGRREHLNGARTGDC